MNIEKELDISATSLGGKIIYYLVDGEEMSCDECVKYLVDRVENLQDELEFANVKIGELEGNK